MVLIVPPVQTQTANGVNCYLPIYGDCATAPIDLLVGGNMSVVRDLRNPDGDTLINILEGVGTVPGIELTLNEYGIAGISQIVVGSQRIVWGFTDISVPIDTLVLINFNDIPANTLPLQPTIGLFTNIEYFSVTPINLVSSDSFAVAVRYFGTYAGYILGLSAPSPALRCFFMAIGKI